MSDGEGLSRRSSLSVLAGLSIATTTTAAAGTPNEPMSGDVANVLDFGARGDGNADDTVAFRNALATGRDIYVPAAAVHYKLSRTLTLARAGQQVRGSGPRSKIVQTGAAQGATAFVLAHDDCGLHALHLIPGTVVTDLTHGWGVAISGARRCVVDDCQVSQMRHGGVLLSDASECRVSSNFFHDSVVRGGDNERQAETGYDIYLMGNSSENLIALNHCRSGAGTGIGCQTASSGKRQSGNVISNNQISGHPCYGIMAYGNEYADWIEDLLIIGNTIKSISGSVRTDGRTHFYGCGIYVASANHFVIANNRVRDTNTDRRLPFASGAVPAGIGVSGFGNGIVSGNLVDGCYHGIASIQASVAGEVGDGTIISDNVVRRCARTGVLLLAPVGATVRGNQLTAQGDAAQGIFASTAGAAHRGPIKIVDNRVRGFGVGIEVRENIPLADITGNEVTGHSGNGIYSGAEITMIQRNRVEGGHGIVIAPDARRGICQANIVDAHWEPVENGSRGAFILDGNVTTDRRR